MCIRDSHTHRMPVALHQQPPGLGPLQDGQAPAARFCDLRVVVFDSGRADDDGSIPQLAGVVADENGDALLAQLCHSGGMVPVAALDLSLIHILQQAETAELIDKVYDGSADQLFAALLGKKSLTREQIDELKRIVDQWE